MHESGDHAIVERLTQQLADKGVTTPREVALSRLRDFGILDTAGALTPYGRQRNAMTPAERAIDRAARRSGRRPSEYRYDPATNRATLLVRGRR